MLRYSNVMSACKPSVHFGNLLANASLIFMDRRSTIINSIMIIGIPEDKVQLLAVTCPISPTCLRAHLSVRGGFENVGSA